MRKNKFLMIMEWIKQFWGDGGQFQEQKKNQSVQRNHQFLVGELSNFSTLVSITLKPRQ